jgi:hypothetical protein
MDRVPGAEMSDQGGGAADIIGHPFIAVGELIAGFVPEGPQRTLVLVIEGLCAVLAPFIFAYYLKLLAHGGAKDDAIERQDYDRLRASLAGDNLSTRLYVKWLTKFLDRIERFFGDAGMADRTLFPRAFGLKKATPLWTAPAFDRCLLLALIYPIATIFVIWAISGHVGPAEAALGLKPALPGLQRSVAAMLFGFLGFEAWILKRKMGLKDLLAWAAVGAVVFGAMVFFATAVGTDFATSTGTVGLFGAFAFMVIMSLTSGNTLAGSIHGAASADVDAVLSLGGPNGGTCAISFGVLVSTAVVVVSAIAFRLRLQGLFLALFLPTMIVSCLGAAGGAVAGVVGI